MDSQIRSMSFPLVNGIIPVIGLRSIIDGSSGKHGATVIIYGGSKEENFRFTVADSLGEKLASLDFNIYCFDFRSNLDASRFHEFGLFDRLEDVREVVRWVLETEKAPLSLLGVSMGGPLAVTIAAELGDKIKNLFLVAPAAYHRDAMKPEVKFGEQFSEIIGKGKSEETWRDSNSLEEIKNICTNILVIKFREDEVTKYQPKAYFDSIGPQATRTRNVRMVTLEGPHNGTYVPSQRQEDIAGAIRAFLALPSMARD